MLTDFYDNYLPQSPLTSELKIIKDVINSLYNIDNKELKVQKLSIQ
ncbi:hypothetical protein JCM31447_25900 [Fluviispira sanaruensis]|uniref:Uncharacterized protein n=1 Tax=Fluviispira sanaruensis TaxID=2493639 RepID=A0A4P2VYW5_FLUSA|nr:hypothetical protein JCM31447_25900 [Fluviispira sanaruensis]